MAYLLQNGHLVDPKNNRDEIVSLLLRDGKAEIVSSEFNDPKVEVIDATGKYLFPGFIDLQVHLREPGREDKENIFTGSRAALKGGVTSVVTMPNTTPVADNASVIAYQITQSEKAGYIRLFPTGAITKGQEGETLSEMKELRDAGAVALTEDGKDVQNKGLLEKAMEWAKTFDMLIMCHSEDESLHDHGVAHEGIMSARLGLSPVSAEVEDLAIEDNIALARKTGVRLHLLHISTKKGVDLLRKAKAEGLPVTGETCPQYFALNDRILEGYNTFAKMYPPIRDEEHRLAILEGLADGTIDAISTDHAPHLLSEKMRSFDDAAFGSVGLETSFALGYTHLVETGVLSLSRLIELFAAGPARVLQKSAELGHLGERAFADLVIFDPEASWTIDPNAFESKGRNCVFEKMKVQGKIETVFVGGEMKMRDGVIL